MGDNLYNQGEQLQLNCSSEGGPVLEYSWLYSVDIIPNTNMNTLIIDNVNTTHAGDYSCNVTNDAGYQSNTVTVYGKLHIPYSAKFWWGKTLANRSFQSFGEENFGEFTAIYLATLVI